MTVAFLQPHISAELAISAFVLAIAVSAVLFWKGWLEVDLLIYSLFPFILFFIFGEVYPAYKFPFILLCVLILSAGIVVAQRSSKPLGSVTVRWLILFFVAVTTWVVASHAAQNYWQMLGDLGYGVFPLECMPNTQDCPLIDNVTPWWVLFFNL